MLSEKEILVAHDKICKLISKRQLKDAFDKLSKLISIYPNSTFSSLLEQNISIYRNFLNFNIKGIEDPEKDNIYARLIQSTYRLNDIIKQHALTENPAMTLLQQKKKYQNNAHFSKDEAENMVEDLITAIELEDLLQNTAISSQTPEESQRDLQEKVENIFYRIWLTDIYTDADVNLVKNLMHSERLPWYYKSVWVTALTFSLFTCYDIRKLDLLIDIIVLQEENVWHRAWTGTFLTLVLYNERLKYYPELKPRIEVLKETLDSRIIGLTILQYIKSKNTSALTKKFEEEIVPDLIKNAPKINEKLNLDNLLKEDFDNDENPDWQKMFEDSEDLYKKIESFSKLQIEGGDIFMSAFSRLKHFSFFSSISNWFTPFYAGNPGLVQTQKLMSNDMLKSIESMPFLCNSDKYSFCLNLQNLPKQQKEMIIGLFSQEMEALAAESELQKHEKDGTRVIQYLQDLYRFFKLFPRKDQFTDIFEIDYDLNNLNVDIIPDDTVYQKVADHYFSIKDYNTAAEMFSRLSENNNLDMGYLQKAGFSFQKTGNYKKAIEQYSKAEILEPSDLWTLKKIAYCLKKSGQFEEAISYYDFVLKKEPDNEKITQNLAFCYLQIVDYEKAISLYADLHFKHPEKSEITRLLAWCYFMINKLDEADSYYSKIEENQLTWHDWMNCGHINICKHNGTKAIECYQKALLLTSLKQFIAEFMSDKEYLIANGFDVNEIPILLDYLRYSK